MKPKPARSACANMKMLGSDRTCSNRWESSKKSLGIQIVREGEHISKMLLELVFLSISYKGTKTAHSNCFEVFKSLVICRDRTTRPNDLQAVTCALLDHHTDSNSVFIADSKG